MAKHDKYQLEKKPQNKRKATIVGTMVCSTFLFQTHVIGRREVGRLRVRWDYAVVLKYGAVPVPVATKLKSPTTAAPTPCQKSFLARNI